MLEVNIYNIYTVGFNICYSNYSMAIAAWYLYYVVLNDGDNIYPSKWEEFPQLM